MDSFGEVCTNIEGEKKLQNDKGDMSIITREVGKGSGTLVKSGSKRLYLNSKNFSS